jgi:hypothetical protein
VSVELSCRMLARTFTSSHVNIKLSQRRPRGSIKRYTLWTIPPIEDFGSDNIDGWIDFWSTIPIIIRHRGESDIRKGMLV